MSRLRFAFLMSLAAALQFQAEGLSGDGRDETSHPTALNVHLPARYKGYQILPGTVSPDRVYGLLFPEFLHLFERSECSLYLVALSPFRVVVEVPLGYSNLAANARCGYGVSWAKDSSAIVVSEKIKWGPERVYFIPIVDGKAGSLIDLAAKVREQVQPDFDAARVAPYNDTFDYIFDSDPVHQWDCNEHGQVVIDCVCTTDPKCVESHAASKSWNVRFRGIWDLSQGKFVKKRIQRLARARL